MKQIHVIKGVITNSIAQELGIEIGDKLLCINGKEIKDVFDYYYQVKSEELVILIEKTDGEQWELEIEKDEDEDLGFIFDEGLMDQYRSCRNRCIFCFIDQMPPGMRETLYFKDDDARLSFLQGNYITLTNMSKEDLDRILFYKLSPINISIHTTNPELRCRMLNNRFAGEALKKLDYLYQGHIEMNSQVVLCKGYNDGLELERTIEELSKRLPYMKSLSVVPVGLTKYRENLENLEKFTKEEAKSVLNIVEKWQKKLVKQYNTRFVYASDEWYFLAQSPIPLAEEYEGYGQIENGVGMVRSFLEEVKEYLTQLFPLEDKKRTISLATGLLAAPVLEEVLNKIKQVNKELTYFLYPIKNEFFGTNITVAGLLTGQDLIHQLQTKELGEELLLPDVLLRNGENVLLDDLTVDDLEKALQVKIKIVPSDGASFVKCVLGENNEK